MRREPSAVCIGIFDGVHRGHQAIVRRTVREARRRRLRPVAVTFDPHPARVLDPRRAPELLYALRHRLLHLEEEGIRRCVVVRFTRAFSRIPAERFVSDVLVRRLGARFICVGPDFRFGRGGRAGVRELGRWAKRHGYRLAVVAPVRSGGAAVSSTRIREAIRRGELRRAAALLGRPVSLYGRVVRGHARGRRLGFPTVNLRLAHETLPPPGVYAVHARCTGRSYGGTLHLGPRPTFGEAGLSAEVYLLDTHKSFYGKEMEIFILRRLRAVRRFPDPARLVRQIERDVRRTRRILRTGRP